MTSDLKRVLATTALAASCLTAPSPALAGWAADDLELKLPWLLSEATVSTLDPAGRPLMATSDARSVHFARLDGHEWVSFLVAESGALDLTLATDRQGHPFLSYRDSLSHDLRVARPTGLGWSVESVDPLGRPGEYSSLAVGPGGQVVVSFVVDDELYLARRDAGAWTTELVDQSDSARDYSALALDRNGSALLAFSDAEGRLELLTWNGNVAELEHVADAGASGQAPALTLDRRGFPIIAYRTGDGELHVARAEDSGWRDEIHDLVDLGGGDLGAFVDAAGRLILTESQDGLLQQGRTPVHSVLLTRRVSHFPPGWQAETFPLTSRNADHLDETVSPGALIDTESAVLSLYRLDGRSGLSRTGALRTFKVDGGLAITF